MQPKRSFKEAVTKPKGILDPMGFFAGGPRVKKAEVIEAPDPDSPEAKKKSQRRQQVRASSGRTSTVMTGTNSLG